ncbi:unnamed protein product [Ectocarpus fasciculatus]
MRDGQNMFVSERRWIKVVAHVIRRLWDMDGRPEDVAAAAAQRRRRTITTTAAPGPSRTKPAAVAATAAPFGMEFQQPVWRPVGGRRGSAAAAAGGGAGGGRYLRGGEAANVTGAHSFLGGLEEDSRSDTTGWGGFSAASRISASDVDGGGGDDEALRAWEEAEDWVGAGRSIAWAPGEEQEEYAQGEAGGLFAAPRGLGAVHGSRRHRTQSGGGGAGSARRGGIAGARRSAVRDAVARRRLDRLDRGSSLLGDAAQGFPADGRSGVSGDGDRGDSFLAAEWDSNARGHTPGEHALDIAGAFLESSLMTRLAGGDWFDDEDAEETSAGSSAAWEPEGAVRVPLGGGPRQHHHSGGALRGRHGGGGGGRSRNSPSRRDGGQRAGRREAHTGWLGDFGPVHTHTVREVAGDVEEQEEEGSGEEEEEGGGARAWGAAGSRDDRAPPRGHRSRSDESTTSGKGSGGHAEEKGGRGQIGGTDRGVGVGGKGDGSASEDVREGGGVDESTGAARGSNGGGVTNEGPGAGDEGNASVNDNGDGDVDVDLGRAGTGDFNVVAPLDGGLDAYLQLASDGGAAVGGGATGGGGGGEEGGGEGPGLGGGSPGGYTGATSGSWWEEDRSALEGGVAVPSPT